MLKRISARSPFPVSVPVLPWSAYGVPQTTGKQKRNAKKAEVHDENTLSVEFVSSSEAAEGFPFGFEKVAGRVVLDSGRRCLLAGLGKKPTVRDYRLAVTSAVREAQKLEASALVLKSLPNNVHSMGDLFQEPIVLPEWNVVEKTTIFAVTAAYKYDRLHSKKSGDGKSKEPIKLYIDSDATDAISHGNVIGSCVNDARSLGNLREDEGNPQLYFEWIKKELEPLGVKVRHVLKGARLQKAGLNLLYNVGKGSRQEPYLVVFEYMGNPQSNETTALVGKGVTFDCGGLNVKPFGSMETMHLDMMGAATVMTAVKAIASLRLPVNVVGAVGLAENAIGPDSYFPSAILTSRKGLTVEVLNTDAEGRLVLADTLTFVQRDAKLQRKISTVIDLATLTGAVLVGLGSRRAGVFSNDLLLLRRLMTGGRTSGDELWPLQIGEEHQRAVKGGIADLVNASAGREAGSCTAAAFLSNFIEDGMRWAHVDIAGAAMGGDKPKGFQPAGAPGFGVQMLLDYFRMAPATVDGELMHAGSEATSNTTTTDITGWKGAAASQSDISTDSDVLGMTDEGSDEVSKDVGKKVQKRRGSKPGSKRKKAVKVANKKRKQSRRKKQ